VNKIEELDKLDRAIKDAEIRLKSIQLAVEQIDKEISVLGPRKLELEQNIEFHKKPKSVPLAQEYKKAKTELSKIKSRLTLITTDRGKAKDACEDVKAIIEKFKRDYQKLLETSENNIVKGTFGGKRGKK
jgi:predicted  nucleic acid-binding Zn-ribbon protein